MIGYYEILLQRKYSIKKKSFGGKSIISLYSDSHTLKALTSPAVFEKAQLSELSSVFCNLY